MIEPATYFSAPDGVRCCDAAPLPEIAALAGTPSFVYAARALDDALREIDQAVGDGPHLVAYAMKANSNHALVARLAQAGAGADVVSGGELVRALSAGVPPDRIVFSGVGKRDDEIELALDKGIRAIHVESAAELDVVSAAAARRGAPARIGLRVNPDVDPRTHPYIATGLMQSKFGLHLEVAEALLPRILGDRSLALEAVACHIGSQVHAPAPLREAVAIVAGFARRCAEAGAPLRSIDAGGGWPLPYGHERTPYASWAEYGAAVRGGIADAGADRLGLSLVVEPGRALVGNAGVLLTRVLYVKEQGGKRFVIVDAAMSELIRPALYQAHHDVWPVIASPADATMRAADVVGPVCESSDFLAVGRMLPELARGDLLAIGSAGAYAMSMASNYNSRPLPAEVLVDGADARIVRVRQPLYELFGDERPWDG